MEEPQHLRSSEYVTYRWMGRWGYCIQWNEEAGLLQINKEIGSASLRRRGPGAVNIWGWKAMADIFCIHCYPLHLDQRLCGPRRPHLGKALSFLWG